MALLPGERSDEPISIKSDELEVLSEDGGRRLVFSRNVVVVQGDMRLRANRLEAVYPQGASQPESLHATGSVFVNQGDREARCQEATYVRTSDTIVCRGNAEVVQGCDRVRGREIEFDLATVRGPGRE
jgi:lipopolysaccharide export system protein LptA